MAEFTRMQVATQMASDGLVPLFYHNDIEVAKKVLTACYKGGARLMEFTNRGDFAHEVFGNLVKYSSMNLPGMIMGAGSIPDAATAALYIQLGANFIVTPVLREDVGLVSNRRKILWIPGCGSLTEIARAEELGAEIVKVFPGSQLGPEFVNAIKGPCPWTNIMATGGVSANEENLRAWFDSGVTCVGMGSKLIKTEYVDGQVFHDLESHVNNTLSLIKKIRNNEISNEVP